MKLLFLGLAGVLGAVIVVWARANSEWATISLPSVMVPGSGAVLEYEARVYALVGLSFLAGAVSSVWIALAVWVRAVRRERRLGRSLERLEAQIAENSGRGSAPIGADLPALPPPKGTRPVVGFDDFDELGGDSEHGLLSDVPSLPEGYDDLDEGEDVFDDDALTDDGEEMLQESESDRG